MEESILIKIYKLISAQTASKMLGLSNPVVKEWMA